MNEHTEITPVWYRPGTTSADRAVEGWIVKPPGRDPLMVTDTGRSAIQLLTPPYFVSPREPYYTRRGLTPEAVALIVDAVSVPPLKPEPPR